MDLATKKAAMQKAAEEFYSRQLGQEFDVFFTNSYTEPVEDADHRLRNGLAALDKALAMVEAEIVQRCP